MIPVANYFHCYARTWRLQIYFRKYGRLLVRQRLARSIVCNCGFTAWFRMYSSTCRLLFFSGSMNIRIPLRARGFVSRRKSGIRYGGSGSGWNNPLAVRAISSTGRLDAAAPVFKHQMLAEVRSMLRAFLPRAFAAEISPASHRSSICVALLAAISQTENNLTTETAENSTREKVTRKTWWR